MTLQEHYIWKKLINEDIMVNLTKISLYVINSYTVSGWLSG